MLKQWIVLPALYIAIFANAQPVDYWQQEVNYEIHVLLDDETHFLHGHEQIEYINHSSDTLKFIWVHLYPNAYSGNNTAFAQQELENGNTRFYYSNEEDRGYIDSLNFEIDGVAAALTINESEPDIGKLQLNQPLTSGNKIIITTSFRVKIPKMFSRMGHIGQQYQISQWYPKPAVYDQKGWHPMPYLNMGEFYSEFGNYDVHITLPANYVIAATGFLKTEEERVWMDAKAEVGRKKFSSEYLPFPSFGGGDLKETPFPMSADSMKTLHYSAANVHDFAWFADKRYNVMNSSVYLEEMDLRVYTWALFLDENASNWKSATQYADSAIYYYSKWVGPYPYPHATVVDGALSAGGGMEYPMITVISGINSARSLDRVIAHELGHNWFYGILGFNERDHAWMDEGINSFYELRYMEQRYPHDKMLPGSSPFIKWFDLDHYPQNYQQYLFYTLAAMQRIDQPMQLTSEKFTEFNYGAIVYSKTPLLFQQLESFIGHEEYDRIVHQFYNEWKFKHPYPEDLKKYFETETRKELDWIFEGLITTSDWLDYKIARINGMETVGNSNYTKLTIINRGKIKAPLFLQGIRSDSMLYQSIIGGFSGKMDVLVPVGDYDRFRIDQNYEMPEINRKNNTLRTNGIFRKLEPLRFQWLASIDNPQRTQIFFTPVLGYNYYDQMHAGMAFYNSVFPSKQIQFALAPEYGFHSHEWSGLANLSMNILPSNGGIQRIRLFTSLSSYNYDYSEFFMERFRFIRNMNGIDLELKKKEARSSIIQIIEARNFLIWNEFTFQLSDEIQLDTFLNDIFNTIEYHYRNKRTIDPYDINIKLEHGAVQNNQHYLIASAGAHFKVNYPKLKRGIDIRLFGGAFIYRKKLPSAYYMNIGEVGRDDYLYQHFFLARSESTGFLSQQIMIKEGGFKMQQDGLSPQIGSTDAWLLTMNVKLPLPKLIPVFGFADFALTPGIKGIDGLENTYNKFQFDAGFGITVIPEIIEIYFPLAFSEDMKTNLLTTEFYDKWYERITFTFNVAELNPFEMIRKLEF